jgi:hypothetical protein
MVFENPVVAGSGGQLVRDSIKSPNFVAGTSGWIVRRDGTAEFSSVTVRGSLVASDGSSSVVITNTTNPRIQFFKSGVVLPAEIVGFRPAGTGDTGIQSSTAGTVGHTKVTQQLDEFGWRVFSGTGITEFGVDIVDGSISAFLSSAATTFVPLAVDGKIFPVGSTTTTSASAVDVNVISANLQNTPVIADRAYIAFFQVGIDCTAGAAGDRTQFKLWNGTVGTGLQVGGAVNKKINTTFNQFETVQLFFIWRALTTEIIANLNLSMNRLTGAGTNNTLIDQNYIGLVLEIGDANIIGGL